jgi:methionine synthase II (cobalamin-independent)
MFLRFCFMPAFQFQKIAGADCGFGGPTHRQIAWAKLRSLVEGAKTLK